MRLRRIGLLFGFLGALQSFATAPPQPQDCSEILARPQFHSSMSKVGFKDYDSVLQNFVATELGTANSKLHVQDAALTAAGFQYFNQTFQLESTIHGFAGPIDTILLERFYKNGQGTRMHVLSVTIRASTIHGSSRTSLTVRNVVTGPLWPLNPSVQPRISLLVMINLGRTIDMAEVSTLLASVPVTIDRAYGLVDIGDSTGPVYVIRVDGTMADAVAIDLIPGFSAHSDSPVGPMDGIGPFGPPKP